MRLQQSQVVTSPCIHCGETRDLGNLGLCAECFTEHLKDLLHEAKYHWAGGRERIEAAIR